MSSGHVTEATAPVVVKTLSRMNSGSVDDQIRAQAATDKSLALNAVVKAWEEQQKEERKMRSSYARRLLWALFAQIGLVNLAFFMIGSGCLKVEEWTARIFIMAVFTEISGMVFFIVKYLFAKGDDGIMKLIEKL